MMLIPDNMEITIKLKQSLEYIYKQSEKVKRIKLFKNTSDDIEFEKLLNERANICANFLRTTTIDVHRVDLDVSFLSNYMMFKGAKKVEKLTKGLFWFTLALVILTVILIIYPIIDFPKYPFFEERISPISSQTYIDRGLDLVHDFEYLVELPKIKTDIIKSPIDIPIQMNTEVQGYYDIYDSRGYNYELYANSSDRTVTIKNVAKINPILIHVIYIEKKYKPEEIPLVITPIPPNFNDSFYILVRGTEYDIKHARRNYTLVHEANVFFNTTIYDSWKNQPFIIYENNIPVGKSKVTPEGFAMIDIISLKRSEVKTYLIKKISS